MQFSVRFLSSLLSTEKNVGGKQIEGQEKLVYTLSYTYRRERSSSWVIATVETNNGINISKRWGKISVIFSS